MNIINPYRFGSAVNPDAWDWSNLVFVRQAELTNLSPLDLFWKSDGSVIYVTGYIHNIKSYNCSTLWDISTASLRSNTSILINGQGIFFKPDGAKMYIQGGTSQSIYEYDLSTAWDETSYSLVNTFATGLTESSSIFLSPDGANMYATDNSDDTVHQWSLSTAWDVSTSSFVQTYDPSVSGSTRGLFFKNDGSRMYLVSGQYDLSTPWDISTSLFNSVCNVPVSRGFYWRDDGELFWRMTTGGIETVEYSVN